MSERSTSLTYVPLRIPTNVLRYVMLCFVFSQTRYVRPRVLRWQLPNPERSGGTQRLCERRVVTTVT